MSLTRRQVLEAAAVAVGLGPAGARRGWAQRSRFRIGACDWSLGMRGRTEAFAVAKQLRLDGVQVSMGGVDNDLQLRRPDVQQAYREASAAAGVQIGGIALDVMNQVPYKSDPRTEQWVSDTVDVAKALGVRVILLAFFDKGDLRDDPAGQAEVIRRLRAVAPRAEKNGVVLGIESWLNAADLMRILDAVGSSGVRVYYDLANSTHMGYDILAEIRQLGRERICEFHAKENGFLLGQGRIDFPAVRKALDAVEYTGWLQIEGAVPKGAQVIESHEQNVRFMRTHFS
jgi:sugar phosphate isomerase/epimerase